MLTDEEWKDIMLGDLEAIRTADDLRVYAFRFRKELADNPHADELRAAYRERVKEFTAPPQSPQ